MACSQRGILQQRKTSQQHAVDSVVLQSQCAETGRLVGTQDESMAPNTGKNVIQTASDLRFVAAVFQHDDE